MQPSCQSEEEQDQGQEDLQADSSYKLQTELDAAKSPEEETSSQSDLIHDMSQEPRPKKCIGSHEVSSYTHGVCSNDNIFNHKPQTGFYCFSTQKRSHWLNLVLLNLQNGPNIANAMKITIVSRNLCYKLLCTTPRIRSPKLGQKDFCLKLPKKMISSSSAISKKLSVNHTPYIAMEPSAAGCHNFALGLIVCPATQGALNLDVATKHSPKGRSGHERLPERHCQERSTQRTYTVRNFIRWLLAPMTMHTIKIDHRVIHNEIKSDLLCIDRLLSESHTANANKKVDLLIILHLLSEFHTVNPHQKS